MNPGKVTVMVVDDDAAVRGGLECQIRSMGWGVESFASTEAFLDRAPLEGTGCLLVDVQMSGSSSTRLQELMDALGGCLPVIFMTGRADIATCARSMKMGAVDFLLKPIDEGLLLEALRRGIALHAGEQGRALRRRGVQEQLGRLSPRERQVMQGVLLGRLNKQIAGDLDIAEKTVKVHRARVMDKMGVRSVAELVRLCGDEAVPSRLQDMPVARPVFATAA